MEPLPQVSVVVATRNRRQLLRETVRSILEGNSLPAEIVVVDQSDLPAPDETWRDAATDIRHVPMATSGLSRATNAGIGAAQHEILVFTHDDVFVAPGWLQALVEPLVRNDGKVVTAGPVVPEPGGAADRVVTLADGRVLAGDEAADAQLVSVPPAYEGRPGKNVLPIVNMAIRRADIVEVGFFDERLGAGTRFPGGDDSDLGFRLLERGYRIVHVPDATVYHRAWRPSGERKHIRWGYARGQGAFYAKHLSVRDRYILARLLHELRSRSRTFARTLVSDRRRASDQLVTISGIICGLAEFLVVERGRERAGRRAGQSR